MRGASVNPSDLNGEPSSVALLSRDQIPSAVEDVLSSTDFIDIHTHLFAPEFGKLGLRGIDELLTYHYLEAELFRSSPIRPEQYWALSKQEQADAIWRALFTENSPISEATRGIIAVLQAFGLPTNAPDLREARAFFEAQRPAGPRGVVGLGERGPERPAISRRIAPRPYPVGLVSPLGSIGKPGIRR
jgi:hypothetical protein